MSGKPCPLQSIQYCLAKRHRSGQQGLVQSDGRCNAGILLQNKFTVQQYIEGLLEQRKYKNQRESKNSSGQVVIVLIKYLYTVALV